MHFSGFDFQDIRLSVTLADFQSRFFIFRQMDILTAHVQKSLFGNRLQKAFRRAVIQNFRRNLFFQLQIDRNRMSLICADFGFIRIEAVALFFIGADDFFEYLHIKMIFAVLIDFLNQGADIRPASLIFDFNSRCLRTVPENQAQKLADSGQIVLFFHDLTSFLICISI